MNARAKCSRPVCSAKNNINEAAAESSPDAKNGLTWLEYAEQHTVMRTTHSCLQLSQLKQRVCAENENGITDSLFVLQSENVFEEF